jgi:hypothetical protein
MSRWARTVPGPASPDHTHLRLTEQRSGGMCRPAGVCAVGRVAQSAPAVGPRTRCPRLRDRRRPERGSGPRAWSAGGG